MSGAKATPNESGELLTFKVDQVVLRRLEAICRRAGMRVPDALRMLLVGAVQRGDFDWSPWDSSVTDNGYMPYETIKKRIEKTRQAKAYQQAYYARQQAAKRAARPPTQP